MTFFGETIDSGVCFQAFFADPDGNPLILHHRYAPVGEPGHASPCERRASALRARPADSAPMTTTHDLAIEAAGLTQALRRDPRARRRRPRRSARAPCSASSGRTAPARRPRSGSSPPCCAPTAARARVAGHDVVTRRRGGPPQIGLTGQYASVDETLTGRRTSCMIGRLLDLSRATRRRARAELLDWFDLADAADRPAKTYSGGMRRRLDLAASLVGRPAVDLPRRADHRPRPVQARRHVGRRPRPRRATAPPSCSPPSTSRRPTRWPTTSSSSTTAASSRTARPDGLKRIVGGQRITVRPADPSALATSPRSSPRSTGTRAGLAGARHRSRVPVDGDERARRHRRPASPRRHRGDRALPAPAQPRRGLLHAHRRTPARTDGARSSTGRRAAA